MLSRPIEFGARYRGVTEYQDVNLGFKIVSLVGTGMVPDFTCTHSHSRCWVRVRPGVDTTCECSDSRKYAIFMDCHGVYLTQVPSDGKGVVWF